MTDLDAFGLWTPARSVFSESTSFDPNALPLGDESVWHIDLSMNPGIANQYLDKRFDTLDQLNQDLLIAAKRFEQFNDSMAREPSGVAFETGGLPQPEQELQRWLNQVGGAAASYGIGETIMAKLYPASPEFQAFSERLMDVVVHYAHVETPVGGEASGQTVVSWTGDMDAAWRTELTPEQVALHYRALALALESRNMYMRIIALATRGAAMLATLPAMLATPGGALVALPAAWKFVNQVIGELEQSRNLQGELQSG